MIDVSGKKIKPFLLALALVGIVYLALGSGTAHAQDGWSETPDDTWATNGTVFDTALSEDEKTLYVAGRFTVVRENGPGEDGGRVGRKNLAAIDTETGEVVRTWKPQVTGGDSPVVRAVEVEDGKVYFGGGFAEINGAARGNVAAVDASDGSLVSEFDPEVYHTNADVDPRVFTILTSDSKVYVGGRFNRVDGKWRANVAALDPATGDYDKDWDPRSSREVYDLEFSSDEQSIFVVGRFGSLWGADGKKASRKTIGRLHTGTGNVHSWRVPEGDIQTASSGAQTGWEGLVTEDRLYAGFGDKGPNYAAAFRLDNGDSGNRVWKRNVVGDVYSLALTPDGERLFFGGHFGINRLRQSACGRPLQGIGALNPKNGNWMCDWMPPLRPEYRNGNGPWEITAIGNQLWVGGGFTHVSGVNQTNLARFTYGAEGQFDGFEAYKDVTKPWITNVNPRGKIRDTTPKVRAKVYDSDSELRKSDIKLFIDGKRVKSFSYDRETDWLFRTKRLSKGPHRAKIVATDEPGNKTVRTWKFRIVS